MMCKQCFGFKGFLTGGLLLVNAFLWPLWTGIDGWFAWIGVIMIIGAAIRMIMPECDGCNLGKCAPAKKSKK